MITLPPGAEQVARLLKARGETLGLAESSTGGLVAAALLAVPGASAFFMGGSVIYTAAARATLLRVDLKDHPGMRPSTEPYARLMATSIRDLLGTTWGLGETGATGPSGNRYGDAAGHSCIAVAGPVVRSITIETGLANREVNMGRFAAEALDLLAEVLEAAT